MKRLLLTLDYELYGDGSGDVFKHVVEPTNEIMALAEHYGVRITIMFEYLEYLRIKQEWDTGNKMGYNRNPVQAMENQLRDAYKRGHDVQLHVHPQWEKACWSDAMWKVERRDWNFGRYAVENVNNERSATALLQEGIATLERILRPVDSTYRVVAMRAGGYNVQPSAYIVRAMRHVGIILDTSITPGAVEDGVLSQYDYRAMSNEKGLWQCGETLECEGNGTVWELPVFTMPIVRLGKYLSVDRLRGLLRNRRSARATLEAKTSNRSGLWGKIRFLFEPEYQTWDFCLLSPMLHRKFLKVANQSHREIFCLVGHPKSWVSAKGMEFLLQHTMREYEFMTVRSLMKDKCGS